MANCFWVTCSTMDYSVMWSFHKGYCIIVCAMTKFSRESWFVICTNYKGDCVDCGVWTPSERWQRIDVGNFCCGIDFGVGTYNVLFCPFPFPSEQLFIYFYRKYLRIQIGSGFVPIVCNRSSSVIWTLKQENYNT